MWEPRLSDKGCECMEGVKTLFELLEEYGATLTVDDTVLRYEENVLRYNKYEVTSAFHKELRRHDFKRAAYWGLVLYQLRGAFYATRYLATVSTEETHCPELKIAMTKLFLNYKHATLEEFVMGIQTFCRCHVNKYMTDIEDELWEHASKVWVEQPTEPLAVGIDVPEDLVAKWAKILPKSLQIVEKKVYSLHTLMAELEDGINTKDVAKIAHAIHSVSPKTWPKLHRYASKLFVDGPPAILEMAELLDQSDVSKNTFWGFDYETMALHKAGLLDACRDWQTGKALCLDDVSAMIEKIKDRVASGKLLPVPWYAIDFHTGNGKRIWNTRRRSIKIGDPSATRILDLRYSAAWVSMMWRYHAFKQHGTIDVNWEDVKMPEAEYFKSLTEGVYTNVREV